MPRRVLVLPAMLILGMALPSPATGEPIQIMGGSVTLVGQFTNANLVDIHGTQGFRGEFVAGDVSGPWLCEPCGPPGTPVSLDAYLDTIGGPGTVEFRGTTYPVGSSGGLPGSAVLILRFLSGPVVLPPLAPRAALSAPFELGSSQLFIDLGDPGPAVFLLAGRGTATLHLTNQSGDPFWELSSLRYEFEPIPEPASLLLVGTGMLALAARRHQRHRSGSRDRTAE